MRSSHSSDFAEVITMDIHSQIGKVYILRIENEINLTMYWFLPLSSMVDQKILLSSTYTLRTVQSSFKRGWKGLNGHTWFCLSQKMQSFDIQKYKNIYVLVGEREKSDKILLMTNLLAMFPQLHIPLGPHVYTE